MPGPREAGSHYKTRQNIYIHITNNIAMRRPDTTAVFDETLRRRLVPCFRL